MRVRRRFPAHLEAPARLRIAVDSGSKARALVRGVGACVTEGKTAAPLLVVPGPDVPAADDDRY